MFKKGDIVVCKKDFSILFEKGKQYKVKYYIEIYNGQSKISITYKPKCSSTFPMNPTSNYYFGHFFYSLKEMRKKKLNKLNLIPTT